MKPRAHLLPTYGTEFSLLKQTTKPPYILLNRLQREYRSYVLYDDLIRFDLYIMLKRTLCLPLLNIFTMEQKIQQN
jgi:hypothetical protein